MTRCRLLKEPRFAVTQRQPFPDRLKDRNRDLSATTYNYNTQNITRIKKALLAGFVDNAPYLSLSLYSHLQYCYVSDPFQGWRLAGCLSHRFFIPPTMAFTRAIRGCSPSNSISHSQIATAFEQSSGQNGLVSNNFDFEDPQFTVLSRPLI